jgi:Uroporphyrinogen decarboxylase (URO-D)
MADRVTPRQLVQAFLQGARPERPLFLPIIFSHGARIENLPLRAFLTNPTKISNALRQIRGRVRADSVTCYFDPLLEAEALGATVEFAGDEGPGALRWPAPAAVGELPEGLRSPEEAAKGGRVSVAVEVIKRLKAILRDECLLMAGVCGPYTLAAQLLQFSADESRLAHDFSASALDLATDTMTAIARTLLEAGASTIVIREQTLPVLSGDEAADWASRLGTTINIVRFYQALPMLLLPDTAAVAANRESIAQQNWDCVVCPALDLSARADWPAGFGAALPFTLNEEAHRPLFSVGEGSGRLEALKVCVAVTTTGDTPSAADMERVNKVWETIRPR